jgi:SAM-dependent methyltransferase
MPVYGKDFAKIYNLKWNDFTQKTWPFLIRMVRLHFPKAQTWLDICCGTGALLKRASAAGYQTAGVDSSFYQLVLAKKNSPQSRLVCQDVRSLALSGIFDIITCMYDSLNYLLETEELKKSFSRIRETLHGGSLFIFDMNTYEGLQDHWNRTFSIKLDQGVVVVDSSFNSEKSLGVCRVTGVIQDGPRLRRFREKHLERGYSAEQIETALKSSGFTYITYDGDRLSQPGMRPSRLLFICRPA